MPPSTSATKKKSDSPSIPPISVHTQQKIKNGKNNIKKQNKLSSSTAKKKKTNKKSLPPIEKQGNVSTQVNANQAAAEREPVYETDQASESVPRKESFKKYKRHYRQHGKLEHVGKDVELNKEERTVPLPESHAKSEEKNSHRWSRKLSKTKKGSTSFTADAKQAIQNTNKSKNSSSKAESSDSYCSEVIEKKLGQDKNGDQIQTSNPKKDFSVKGKKKRVKNILSSSSKDLGINITTNDVHPCDKKDEKNNREENNTLSLKVKSKSENFTETKTMNKPNNSKKSIINEVSNPTSSKNHQGALKNMVKMPDDNLPAKLCRSERYRRSRNSKKQNANHRKSTQQRNKNNETSTESEHRDQIPTITQQKSVAAHDERKQREPPQTQHDMKSLSSLSEQTHLKSVQGQAKSKVEKKKRRALNKIKKGDDKPNIITTGESHAPNDVGTKPKHEKSPDLTATPDEADVCQVDIQTVKTHASDVVSNYPEVVNSQHSNHDGLQGYVEDYHKQQDHYVSHQNMNIIRNPVDPNMVSSFGIQMPCPFPYQHPINDQVQMDNSFVCFTQDQNYSPADDRNDAIMGPQTQVYEKMAESSYRMPFYATKYDMRYSAPCSHIVPNIMVPDVHEQHLNSSIGSPVNFTHCDDSTSGPVGFGMYPNSHTMAMGLVTGIPPYYFGVQCQQPQPFYMNNPYFYNSGLTEYTQQSPPICNDKNMENNKTGSLNVRAPSFQPTHTLESKQ